MIERTEIEEGIALELISYVASCQNEQIFNTYDVCILLLVADELASIGMNQTQLTSPATTSRGRKWNRLC
jgi:hypothetical protein